MSIKTILSALFSLLLMSTINVDAQTLRDKSGMRIGEIESNGTVRDRSGMRIGEIDSRGTIRDKSGMRIGEVESNGTVRDRSGMRIGEAKGVNRKHAAVFFFFNNF